LEITHGLQLPANKHLQRPALTHGFVLIM